LRQAEVRLDIAFFAVERCFGVYAVFDLLALLQDFLCFGLILPEIGIAGFCF
jgi:hypothetical protein